MSARSAALLPLELASLGTPQWTLRRRHRRLDGRAGDAVLEPGEAVAQLAVLPDEGVASGCEPVAFGDEFGVAGLDPAPSLLFAGELRPDHTRAVAV
jgi:hypothetical protein